MPTGGTEKYRSIVVKTEFGFYTNDKKYQTADGRWWKDWDGQVRTGQELRKLYF